MTLGNYIKSLRETKKYSQRKLALSADLSNTTISRIENDLVTPDTESLNKIAIALGTPLENFLSYTLPSNTISDDSLSLKDKRDIAKDLDSIMSKIDSGEDSPLYYNGQEMSEEDRELFKDALEFALKRIKIENKKKYTPKKYRH